MVQIELAYMNTNHPDFIGFDKYVLNIHVRVLITCMHTPLFPTSLSCSASKGKQARKDVRALSNQVIRKGWLGMPVKFSTREYWFVLTSESLTWYKDSEVTHFHILSLLPPFISSSLLTY